MRRFPASRQPIIAFATVVLALANPDPQRLRMDPEMPRHLRCRTTGLSHFPLCTLTQLVG